MTAPSSNDADISTLASSSTSGNRLRSKLGQPSSSSPRTTENNRKRLGGLFGSLTAIASSPLRRTSSTLRRDGHEEDDDVETSSTPVASRLWNWLTTTSPIAGSSLSGQTDTGRASKNGQSVVDGNGLSGLEEGVERADLGSQGLLEGILNLPDEILIQILLHLPTTATQLHNVSLVSKRFFFLSQSAQLWYQAYISAGYDINEEIAGRLVATETAPLGHWEGLNWHASNGDDTSGNPISEGGQSRFTRDPAQIATPTKARNGTPSKSLFTPQGQSPWSTPHNAKIPDDSTPVHYPTLYRSRKALDHHIRNPTTSHTPHEHLLHFHTDSVYCLQVHSGWMISGSRDRSIILWKLGNIDLNGNVGPTKLVTSVIAHTGSVLALDFEVPDDPSEKGLLVTGSSDMTAGIWEVDWSVDVPKIDRVQTLRGHTWGVLDVALAKDRIVTCSKDESIRIYDRRDYTCLHVLQGQSGAVNCLALNPDLEVHQVVSASGNGTWVVWDTHTGEEVRRGGGTGRGLACVLWQGEFIVTGDNDRTVKMYNAKTSELLKTFKGHTDLVRSISLDLKAGLLVSGSYDRSIRMWDINTGKLIRRFEFPQQSLIFDVHLSTTRLISASNDSTIQVFTFGSGLPYLNCFE